VPCRSPKLRPPRACASTLPSPPPHPHPLNPRLIRNVLDTSGGASIKIISKIENEAGLEHCDDVLKHSDGVMVARGDLAMEVGGAV
jgi:hypothetical protein